jgi:hypothetical protein
MTNQCVLYVCRPSIYKRLSESKTGIERSHLDWFTAMCVTHSPLLWLETTKIIYYALTITHTIHLCWCPQYDSRDLHNRLSGISSLYQLHSIRYVKIPVLQLPWRIQSQNPLISISCLMHDVSMLPSLLPSWSWSHRDNHTNDYRKGPYHDHWISSIHWVLVRCSCHSIVPPPTFSKWRPNEEWGLKQLPFSIRNQLFNTAGIWPT